MGQILPLPERIPKPRGETEESMKACGIRVNNEPDESYHTDQQYVTYSLPIGWRTVDNSQCAELPIFYIVDNNNMVRFSITGTWRETYDNDLHLNTIKEPYEFKPLTR